MITNNSAYSTYDLQSRVQQGTLANAGPSRAVIRVGLGGGTGVPKSSNVLCRQVSASSWCMRAPNHTFISLPSR